MFITLLHPFADLRSFIQSPTGRLTRPAWPLANQSIDFVRSSGVVMARRAGGLPEWAGEELYTDGRNAFRFPDRLRTVNLGTTEAPAYATRIFRRFNSSGVAARMEISARIEVRMDGQLNVGYGVGILNRFLNTQICVRNGTSAAKPTSLIAAGLPLSAHYLHATTSREPPVIRPTRWWFNCGVPIVVIDCPESPELMNLPNASLVVESPQARASVWHAWFELGNQRCGVWVLRRQPGGDSDALRQLRVHLLRFHAERETLRLVLQSTLSRQPGIAADRDTSEAMQEYLNDAIRLVEKRERHGVMQSALFDSASIAISNELAGHTTTLIQVRRQVAAKIAAFLNRPVPTSTIVNVVQGDQVMTNIQLGNITVSGDFTFATARNITNSFNKADSADVKDDIKEALKNLTVQVTNLAKSLAPEPAEHATNDLAALVNEATATTPPEGMA